MLRLLSEAWIAALATSLLIVDTAAAQEQRAAPVQATPAFRSTADTPHEVAAAAAATRATNICSGLWMGELPMEIIERYLNGRDPSLGEVPRGLRTDIDSERRTVSVTYAEDMPARHVMWRPARGCVQLPIGAGLSSAIDLPSSGTDFRPPDLDSRQWPMGDRNAAAHLPGGRGKALDSVVDAAFGDTNRYGGTTWAVIVLVDGKIAAERYALGFDLHKASQTYSAAKSFAATLLGMAVGDGKLELDQPGVLSEWRRPLDPRRQITLANLMHMTSGLYTEGGSSPMSRIYTEGGTVAELAATNFLDTLPGTRFVYAPTDTMLAMRAVREAMADDAAYREFPYRRLFWKIGMTRTATNTDWNGDYLMSGQSWSSARDLARFGLLYQNDGVWLGERILPTGWARYVATRSAAQPPRPPYYGAFFWVFGGVEGLPADAFSPMGGQGHFAMIIPSKRVVVVRRGFDLGADGGFKIARFSADVLGALAD